MSATLHGGSLLKDKHIYGSDDGKVIIVLVPKAQNE